jgi:lysophospholipase L1-like esterase
VVPRIHQRVNFEATSCAAVVSSFDVLMSFFVWLPFDYLLGLGAWLAGLFVAALLLLRWRRSRRMAMRSLRGPHTGLVVWLILIALTIPEVLCALFYDATDSFSQTNVSRRWFDRHVVTNRAGYRDARELPTTRDPSQRYVAFIGDSFTFGHGVKNVADRFSDRVGVALRDDNVVAFNVALPGLDIRTIAQGMPEEFDKLGVPADVVVYTFVPNDIEYCDERTAEFYQQRASQQPSFFLWKQTYFYNWLYHRLSHFGAADSGDYYGYLRESYEGSPWKCFTQNLDQLDAWCRARKARLLVVIFPFLTNLDEQHPFRKAYARLREHCAQNQIPCADLTSEMMNHQREGLVVSRFDAHPNERAHRIAAEAITPVVESLLGEAP